MHSEKEISLPETINDLKISRWRRIISLCLLPGYALIGWLRLAEVLNNWDYLLELNIWPRPLYFAITGTLIGAGFTLALVFLLLKCKFGGRFNRILGGVFLVWFWADRIWFSLRDAFFNQLFVAFLITAITLIWMFLLTQKTDLQRKGVANEPQT
jgi:hypothetical protein